MKLTCRQQKLVTGENNNYSVREASDSITDIIAGLIYEHTTLQPVVAHKLDETATLLIFFDSKDIAKICNILQSIKTWLGCRVKIGCDVATPKQVLMGDQLHWVEREEIVLRGDVNTQMQGPIPELKQHISCPSEASQLVSKMPNLAYLAETLHKRGRSNLSNGNSKLRLCDAKSHGGNIEGGNSMSLCGAMADLVQYLGLQAPVSEVINKLELVYGTVASFYILMQNLYKLQQGKTEKVPVYFTHLEGEQNVVQQEYPTMLSMGKVQKYLRDHLFHGLHKQLHDSMCYLYDDLRIMYFPLMTAAIRLSLSRTDPGTESE